MDAGRLADRALGLQPELPNGIALNPPSGWDSVRAVSWGRVLFAIWITCSGCMEASPRPEDPSAGAPSPVAPAAPPPSAPGPSEAAPPKPRLPIRFEAVPAPVARAEGPHLEIVSPASGDQLSESKAATVPI